MKAMRIICVALISMFFFASVANASMTIRIAHPNIPAHPMGQGYELFKKELETRSNGFFKVKIYDSSKFGNFDAVVQGIMMGVLHFGSDGVGNFSSFDQELMIYDMPFLFSSYEQTDIVNDGAIGQDLASVMKRTNMIPLGYIEIGFKQIFSKRPIRTLEDARNLKIRATASKTHIAGLQSLGMNPTPIAWGEVYTTLQQGTIDAIDIDLNLGYFNKFHEIAKYVTITNSVYTPHLVLMNSKFWDSLNEEQRGWVMDSFNAMKEFERKINRETEEKVIKEMKAMGCEIIELSDEERQRWIDKSAVVYKDFSHEVDPELVEKIRNTVVEE